jgi:nucleoside-diphosphate-sugar epimerase
MASKGISPIVGDGIHPQVSMVYVQDVIQSIWKAYEFTKPGVHEYFISGPDIHTWSEIRATTARILDKKIAPVYIKPGIVQKLGILVEKSAGLFGIYPVLNSEKAKEMIHEWTCTIDKAKLELNYEPNYSLEEGIARTLHWYKQHHWL